MLLLTRAEAWRSKPRRIDKLLRIGVYNRVWVLQKELQMPSTVAQLYKQALRLSEKGRQELAARLLRSLDPHDLKLHPEWDEEILRRLGDPDTEWIRCHSVDEAMRILMSDVDDGSQSRDSQTRAKRRRARSRLVRKA